MEDRHDDPVAITTAQVSRSDELRARQNRYLVSMLIRTICFLLAVVVTGWARWVFVVGALVLPYVAVVFANTARRKPSKQADVLHPEPIGQLEAGPSDDNASDDSARDAGSHADSPRPTDPEAQTP